MSKAYYSISNDLPPVEAAIKDTMIYYLWEKLFSKEETFEQAKKRFVKSAVTEDADLSFYDQSAQTKITNSPLPFLAWNIGEYQDNTKLYNYAAKNRKYYSPHFDCYIGVIPSIMEMTFIGFYEKYSDYIKALSYLQFDLASLTQLDIPIKINDIETSFSAVVNIDKEVKNGSYTGNFKTWLEKGKINDFVATFKIQFPKIFVDSEVIGNIDIAEFNMRKMNGDLTFQKVF